MARMSVDDSVLRDTRVKRLAKAMGWSRRETIGALLDVWAVAYDRVSPVLHVDDVNEAAEADTFCAQLVAADLASLLPDDARRVRLSGVEDRIGYLSTKQKAGRQGGVKSGESRRSKKEARASSASKQTFAEVEAPANPSASASSLHSAPSDPSAAVLPSAGPPPDPVEPRRREASAIWREFQDARQRVARELSQVAPILAENDQGRRELQERIRELQVEAGESLESAAARCRHALARAAFEAKRAGNFDWFGGGMWTKGQFDRFSSRPLETQRHIPVLDLTNYVHPFEGKPLWEEQE
jgi:hypothetical protein